MVFLLSVYFHLRRRNAAMLIPALRCAGSIALLLADASILSGGVTAIETTGSGSLTMCRDWLVYDSCMVYDRVDLPKRIAVGDRISLSFDSDNKHFSFPVARLVKTGIDCTVLSEDTNDANAVNRIKVPACLDVSNPR
jgi:hypothetical protein